MRSRTTIPVASCECLFGRRDYRPFFEQQAVDVAIIDTPWNGVGESLKIAAMADTYEINVAPHNFYGHLATMMNAHWSAVVPNLRIMETDPDMVPWQDDLVTVKPRIENGHLLLPTGPGWGTEVNEEAVRAHPPKRRLAAAGYRISPFSPIHFWIIWAIWSEFRSIISMWVLPVTPIFGQRPTSPRPRPPRAARGVALRGRTKRVQSALWAT